MIDYYKILEISPASTKQAIKKAYRRLANKHHPDKNQGDTTAANEKFKQIVEAYSVLSNTQQRKQYDDQRRQNQQSSSSSTHSFHQQFNNRNNSSHSTKNQNSKPAQKPQDTNVDIQISLMLSIEEAHLGVTKIITLNAENNGHVEKKSIPIKIPQGIKEGKNLRLKKQGHHMHDRTGDLFVKIQFKKHSLFKLYDNNLIMIVPISVSDAVLGTTITVPTLSSSAKVKIPSGIHSGNLLKLKNLGFFSENGLSRGDLILEIHIDIPDQITEEEKLWFKKFKDNRALPPSVAHFNIQVRKFFLKKAA